MFLLLLLSSFHTNYYFNVHNGCLWYKYTHFNDFYSLLHCSFSIRITFIISIIIIKNESAVQGWERVRPLYRSEDPNPTQPWKEEKEKIVGDKKKEQIRPTGKPDGKTIKHRVTRSFHRDTERGTKGLQYWEVLQRGGAKEWVRATKAPRVTRAGTYSKCTAPLRGFFGFLFILNSIHSTATDRRWEWLHFNTPPANKLWHSEHRIAEEYFKSGRTGTAFPWGIWDGNKHSELL